MDLNNLLAPGFFLDRGTPRYEHVANICYKCGVLGYGKKYGVQDKPTIVDSPHYPTVNVYGLWIKLDSHKDSCFTHAVSVHATSEEREENLIK